MYYVFDCTLKAIFLSSVTSTSSGPFLIRWSPSDPHHHLPPEVTLEGESDPTGRCSSFASGVAFSSIIAVPLPLSPQSSQAREPEHVLLEELRLMSVCGGCFMVRTPCVTPHAGLLLMFLLPPQGSALFSQH